MYIYTYYQKLQNPPNTDPISRPLPCFIMKQFWWQDFKENIVKIHINNFFVNVHVRPGYSAKNQITAPAPSIALLQRFPRRRVPGPQCMMGIGFQFLDERTFPVHLMCQF